MHRRIIILAENKSQDADRLAAALQDRHAHVEVICIDQLAGTAACIDQAILGADCTLFLIDGAPSKAMTHIAEFAQRLVPVMSWSESASPAFPKIRRLSSDPADAAAEICGSHMKDQAKQDRSGTRWGILTVAAFCFAAGIYLVWHIMDDLSARRAMESDTLAALDAYLDGWEGGAHRQDIGRERVSRVTRAIPILATLAADSAAPPQEERAWLDFDAEDWSRLPAIVLLRIASEKHGMAPIAAAAREGDGAAAHILGTAFYFGAFFMDRDRELAKKLYSAACAVDLQRGCFNVGHKLALYSDSDTEIAEGFRIILESCKSGIEIACLNISALLKDHGQATLPGETQESFLKKRCQEGSTYLCAWLGYLIQTKDSVTESERDGAIALIRNGCEVSIPTACHHLGKISQDAKGGRKDEKRAAELFRLSCNGGLSNGCWELSEAFYAGRGVGKDEEQSIFYADLACKYGESGGCFRMGYQLATDRNSDFKDVPKGVRYYEQGCRLESISSCLNLALLHSSRSFPGANRQTAFELLEKTCDQFNHPRSCAAYGHDLIKEKNISLGLEKLTGACKDDDVWGCIYLGEALRDGKVGDIDINGARIAFEKAIEIDPEITRAKTALEALTD